MEQVNAAQVRAWRLHSQGLAGTPAPTVVEAVRRAGALQAQDAKACRLQLRARSQGLVASDMDAACGAGLSSVEAGSEVFTGKAQLDTTAYSTNVG
jgi:hypothetical protein